MSMVVKNNMSAISTLNTLNKNSSALASSLKKVSSGMKINSAADDASGYAISERMRVQIRGLDQANNNTQNGTSMMKVAEGAVSSTVDILKTLKEKVINAANDTNTDSDRATIQKELDQSIDQINDNANVTYNGKYLVDGSHNSKVTQTTTALTNESLFSTTNSGTAFSDMKDRNGNSLNIQGSDTITMSVVKEGKTETFSAYGSQKLNDLVSKSNALKNGADISSGSTIGSDVAGDTVNTADGGNAITTIAHISGCGTQIISCSRSEVQHSYDILRSSSATANRLVHLISISSPVGDFNISLSTCQPAGVCCSGTKFSSTVKAINSPSPSFLFSSG